MLEKATDGLAPDLTTTTWAAFSGVLTDATIKDADWKKTEGGTKQKAREPRSVNAFNITAFEGPEAPAPPTPIQHTVHQLTDAKVNAQPTPDGYETPVDPANFLLPWAAGARGTKRKRTREGAPDSDSDSMDEEEGEDDDEEDEVEEEDDDGASQ